MNPILFVLNGWINLKNLMTHKIFLDRYLKVSNIFKIIGYNELK